MTLLKEPFLREKFIVWGIFEKVKIASDFEWKRPVARIMRRDRAKATQPGEHRADAVIVMLNQGTCKPIKPDQLGVWTESKADRTQYQLMRLMERMEWDELKIVSLSDLCEGNPYKFFSNLKRCKYGDIPHSRFADNPLAEWSKVISSADRLLYGWGAKIEAKEMANTYGLLELDEMTTIYGKKPEALWDLVRGYPRHPNPRIPERCEAWLEDMVGVLSK